MNIENKHSIDKVVSVFSLFKGTEGNVIAIQILTGEQLKKHKTESEALLLCVKGKARFQTENGIVHDLTCGDYVFIEPNVEHWVDGIKKCQLVIYK